MEAAKCFLCVRFQEISLEIILLSLIRTLKLLISLYERGRSMQSFIMFSTEKQNVTFAQ